MIPLPRLFDKNGNFVRVMTPINVSLTLNMKPLSSATIDFRRGESVPSRSYLELFSPYGSAGMFRARAPQDTYGNGIVTVECEHMISDLGDYLVKEEISKMQAAASAVKKIFKHYKGGYWKLGDVSALGSGKVALSINYDNVLNSILSVLDQKQDCMLAYNFTTKPWTVSIVKKPTTVTAECRMSRNASEAQITYDDSEMCTRVFYDIPKKNSKGEMVSDWHSIDAPTIGTYGVVERTVSTSSDMTKDEVLDVARTFLKEHQQPRVSVRIEGIELSDITGESMDQFTVGKLLRLAIPEDSINVEKNIHGLNWANVYGEPRRVTVLIGDEEDTVVTFIHNLDSKGKGSGGGGGGGGGKPDKEKAEMYKRYETKFNQTDEQIEMYAKETARNGEILKQAGMQLDRNGVLIYSRSAKTNLQSMIDVQSNRIDLVVKGYGKDATIDAASIVVGINKRTGSFIKLQAKQIELSGYVTMSAFNAQRGTINNLMTGHTVASALSATTVSASVLKVAGTRASWKLANIPGYGYINYLGQ